MATALWSSTKSMTSRARSLNSVIVKDSTASMLSSSCVRLICCSIANDGKYYMYFSYEKYETCQYFKFSKNKDLHGGWRHAEHSVLDRRSTKVVARSKSTR